jgi:hypothetical protein
MMNYLMVVVASPLPIIIIIKLKVELPSSLKFVIDIRFKHPYILDNQLVFNELSHQYYASKLCNQGISW